jgi:hypothetical protein
LVSFEIIAGELTIKNTRNKLNSQTVKYVVPWSGAWTLGRSEPVQYAEFEKVVSANPGSYLTGEVKFKDLGCRKEPVLVDVETYVYVALGEVIKQ